MSDEIRGLLPAHIEEVEAERIEQDSNVLPFPILLPPSPLHRVKRDETIWERMFNAFAFHHEDEDKYP